MSSRNSKKRGFMSSKISNVRTALTTGTTGRNPVKKRARKGTTQEDADAKKYKEFMQLATMDTIAIGKERLRGHKRLAEENRLREMQGEKARKAPKMPFKMLLAQRTREREREEAHNRKLKAMGAYVHQKKTKKGQLTADEYLRKKVSDLSGLGSGVGRGERGFRPAVGHFKGGMLKISEADIERVVNPGAIRARARARQQEVEWGGGKGAGGARRTRRKKRK